MSQREKLFWLCLGSAFIVLILSLIPSYYEICEVTEKAKDKDCANYQLVPFIAIKMGQFLDKAGVAVTALATIAIAAFTLTLKRATDRLWDAGERQLKLMEAGAAKQALDTQILQRAYISVNIGGIYPYRTEDSTEDKHTVNGIVDITNVGNLPASKTSCCIKIGLSDTDSFEDLTITDADYFGNYILPPGGIMKQGSSSIDLCEKGYVYVWGQVRYFDGFGHPRSTNFCHRYPRIMLRKLESGRYGISETYGRYHLTGNYTDEG